MIPLRDGYREQGTLIVRRKMFVCKARQGVEVGVGLAYDLPDIYVPEVPERGVGSSFRDTLGQTGETLHFSPA